jgi:hypothetical protein
VFANDYRHATTASLLRLAQGRRVRDVFERAGIPAVLLKGGAFLVRFAHGDAGIRPMSDLDLLVDRRQFAAAATLLRAEGYVTTRPERAFSSRTAPGQSFVRHGGPLAVEIDLHRTLAQWPLNARLTDAVLRDHVNVDGWRVPSIADAIAHACVHRSRHAFVWSCLDLWDVRTLVDELDDEAWAEAQRRFASFDATASVYATFRQALFAFGSESPQDRARQNDLSSRLGSWRRRWLDRIAPAHGPFAPQLEWDRPLRRNAIVQPLVSGSLGRSVAAAVAYLPLRMVEGWTLAGGDRRGRERQESPKPE